MATGPDDLVRGTSRPGEQGAPEVTGHVSARRWTAPGGGERLATEITIDTVTTDTGLWLRADGPVRADLIQEETS